MKTGGRAGAEIRGGSRVPGPEAIRTFEDVLDDSFGFCRGLSRGVLFGTVVKTGGRAGGGEIWGKPGPRARSH